MRFKSNKQAFIIAVLVVLLCLVCLAGATLALFTSDPNDGTIGIVTTSGNVDVDIVDPTNTEHSFVDNVLQFHTSAENQDVIFEPGAGFYTQGFKIVNKGNIPINFYLTVSKDDDEDGVDMEQFAKDFEVLLIKNTPDDPNAEIITDFEGRLEAGEICADTYYLYIKMKETAGNEFQNNKYTGIGVTVYAVQGNVDIEETLTNEQNS